VKTQTTDVKVALLGVG